MALVPPADARLDPPDGRNGASKRIDRGLNSLPEFGLACAAGAPSRPTRPATTAFPDQT